MRSVCFAFIIVRRIPDKEKKGNEGEGMGTGDCANLTTLCYLEKEESYLMMHRVSKTGDANQGKWIGVGGHFKEGESPEECLLREVQEETGLELTSYRLRGIITFVSDEWECEYMYLYTADGFEGTLTTDRMEGCREGILKWIPKSEIFSLNLWEGDKVFLELLFKEERFFSLKLQYQGDTLAASAVKVY